MNNTYKQGMMSAIGCAMVWGFMPLYWKTLQPIESSVIIFYRIVLVALVCFLMALKVHGWNEIKTTFNQKGVKGRYFIAGLLITMNWSIYIWAVNANYVIQTCIGYYIEPLIVCLLSVILFKEKLDKYKILALILATAGVLVVILHFKQLPAIALSLGISFAFYAAIKKNYSMPPLLSLLYETIFLVPIALGVIIYLELNGAGAMSVGGSKYLLLMLCGIFTATPLLLFANAANKINFFALGITEYISPTISLLISIFIFKEPFDGIQLIAFGIIWIGLVFFSYGEYRLMKGKKVEGHGELQ